MDLRTIQYFVCLYEEGNVTRAARRLNVVQPALSMQIRKFEREFGLALFDRTPRGMVPTAAGRAVYQLYLPILKDMERARQRLLELGGKVLGKIAVGVIHSVGNSVLADALARYSETFPDVEIRVDEAYSGTLVDWVAAGDLDFAVVNRTRKRSGLTSLPLVSEELLLVSAGSGLGPPVRFHDLPAFKLVLPSRRHGLRMAIDQTAEREDIEVLPRLEVDALTPTLELVAAGDFVTVLPTIAVRKGLTGLALRVQRIVAPRILRELVCVHHAQRPLSLASTKFLDLLRIELTRTIDGMRFDEAAQ